MQNYKDVCGNNKCVWVEILSNNRSKAVEFLHWVKSIGCVWLNGKKINPKQDAGGCIHFSIHNDGKLTSVSMLVWVYCKDQSIPWYSFSDLSTGKMIPIQNSWMQIA